MKRRVLRAHTNKHNLRQLSAANALVPGAYNVLCDASFLRAVLIAYTHDHIPRPRRRHKSSNNKRNNATTTTTTPPPHIFAYLRQHVEEAFAVLDSNNSSKATTTTAAAATAASRKATQLHVRYLCLPTTTHALRRLVRQHNDSNSNSKSSGKTSSACARRHGAGGAAVHAASATAVHGDTAHKHLLHRVLDMRHADKLLRSLEVLRRDKTAAAAADAALSYSFDDNERNEAKAIAEVLQYCAALRGTNVSSSSSSSKKTTTALLAPLVTSRYGSHTSQQQQDEEQQRPLSTTPNAHCLFVATQSHDVRRALPPDAAVLRLARQPTCVWVERCGSTFHYTDDNTHKATAAATAAGAATAAVHSGSVHAPSRRVQLSAADVAFMASLDKPSKTAATTTATNVTTITHAPPSTDAVTADAAAETSATPRVVGKRPRSASVHSSTRHTPRRASSAAVAHANPLSCKKKRKREVFRVDQRK